jgi:hypothetical protein
MRQWSVSGPSTRICSRTVGQAVMAATFAEHLSCARSVGRLTHAHYSDTPPAWGPACRRLNSMDATRADRNLVQNGIFVLSQAAAIPRPRTAAAVHPSARERQRPVATEAQIRTYLVAV